ncbi:hypothetical protein [Ensifer canadensis]
MPTTKIIDLVPDNARTVFENPEYSVWRSHDGYEVWIDTNQPDTYVTDSILKRTLFLVWSDGSEPKKVTMPDSRALGMEFGKRKFEPVDIYNTDIGTVEIIDLKRQEAEAPKPATEADDDARFREKFASAVEAAKQATPKPATVTGEELRNEALNALRAIVRDDFRASPVQLEAIRLQFQSADALARHAE